MAGLHLLESTKRSKGLGSTPLPSCCLEAGGRHLPEVRVVPLQDLRQARRRAAALDVPEVRVGVHHGEGQQRSAQDRDVQRRHRRQAQQLGAAAHELKPAQKKAGTLKHAGGQGPSRQKPRTTRVFLQSVHKKHIVIQLRPLRNRTRLEGLGRCTRQPL